MGNTLNDVEGVSRAYFNVIEQKQHPVFGTVQVLKLSHNPSELNDANPLIKNAQMNQLYMSVQGGVPKLVLLHVLHGIVNLQKLISYDAQKPFLQLVEIDKVHNGFVMEYEEKSIEEEIQIRRLLNKRFQQSELLYVANCLSGGCQNMLITMYLDEVLKTIPLSCRNVMINSNGMVKMSSYAIYLANPQHVMINIFANMILG